MAFLILALFLVNCFSEASLNSRSIDFLDSEYFASSEWNPRKDAIYDAKTGLCYFEENPEYLFPSSQLEAYQEALKTPSIAETASEAFTSPGSLDISSPFAYSNSSSPSRSTFFHVPEKCKNYERKWDFHVGNPEEVEEAIGWISRIGFVDNFINDVNLSTQNSSYTLLPYGFCSKACLWNQLGDSYYLEINFRKWRLFYNLFAISSKIDSKLRNVIIAIKIHFDYDSNVSIKIFVNRQKDLQLQEDVYHQLVRLYPEIYYYQKY